MNRQKLRFFRCYPEDFLFGCKDLNDEQVTAYVRLVFTMYAMGGPLKNDPKALRWVIGKTSRRPTIRVINELVALGKLSIEDGFIHNLRTDRELARLSGSTPETIPQTNSKTQPEKTMKTTRARAGAFRSLDNNNLFSQSPSSARGGSPLLERLAARRAASSLSQADQAERLAQLKAKASEPIAISDALARALKSRKGEP